LARDLAVALSNCGFEAQVCDEPDVVVKHAEALRPDVLIIAVGEEPARDFAIAETIWSNPSFRGLEIVFIANSQELRRKILRNGISDEWFVTTSADLQAFSAALLRRVFNVKVGREVCNRAWLMPFLPTLKELSASETAATPPWPTFAAKRSGARAAGSAVCKGKILVVDDDRHLVELVAEVLSTNGFEPVKAYSGFQALQLATKEKPDLIITDFEMANGSGEYLIANLKMSSVTNAIKVLLMTRANVFEKYGLEDDAVSRLNVVACLRKPLDMNALVAEVETNLASAWR
jgi:CheY-like chemotaxis protein